MPNENTDDEMNEKKPLANEPQEKSAGTPQPADSNAVEPANDGDDGRTARVEPDGSTEPRLPHEHDQSADSQKHPGGEPTEVGKQAYKDTQSPSVDTDRAPVTDKVYNEKLKR